MRESDRDWRLKFTQLRSDLQHKDRTHEQARGKFSVVTLAELEKVLEFIYTGSVSFDNIQHFERFVANVKKLGLRRLPNLEEP